MWRPRYCFCAAEQVPLRSIKNTRRCFHRYCSWTQCLRYGARILRPWVPSIRRMGPSDRLGYALHAGSCASSHRDGRRIFLCVMMPIFPTGLCANANKKKSNQYVCHRQFIILFKIRAPPEGVSLARPVIADSLAAFDAAHSQ